VHYNQAVRIGIFTDTYTPEVNGVVTVIEMMSRELEKDGHEVFLFCPKYPGQSCDDDKIHRFPSVRFVFYKGMRMAIPFSRKAYPVLSSLDVIHSHDPGPMGLLAVWASGRYHIPHIHTYHDLYIEYRRYLPRAIRPTRDMVKRMSRIFSRRCDAIIAPSEQMRSELKSYGIDTPIHALPFGVDEQDFLHEPRLDARKMFHLPTQDLLLYAGRVGKEKNLDFLLRAFENLLSVRPSARLIIAGDGPHRSALQEYASNLKIDKLVTFTGFLKRRDLIDLYKQITLFVFPSLTDTQGLVVMEAMMAGAAVVAVNVLGPVDVIQDGNTGVLVNPDEEEFAGACLGLLQDNDARIAMGQAARMWARANTSRASIGRLLEIYNDHARTTGVLSPEG
jgi:1,2-diacylglycerol 3-alpha-glucosyltransferase